MWPRWGDFTDVYRSSLAKSLISLHSKVNIMHIIGLLPAFGRLEPPKSHFDPPLAIFAAGAFANDPNTHPSPQIPVDRC
jgi:hypothetical protein